MYSPILDRLYNVLNDHCRNIARKQQTPTAYYRSRVHVRVPFTRQYRRRRRAIYTERWT